MESDEYNKIATLETIKKIINRKIPEPLENLNRYYRGQSDSSWDLTPSILRINSKEPIIQDNDLFSYIAKCQHEGIPTRFLDYTQDPKVALYFACCDNLDKNGRLFCPYYDTIDETHSYTTIICELSQLTKPINVNDFAENLANKYDLDLASTIFDLLGFLESGFMLTPSYSYYEMIRESNPRMYKQQGCFYICSNKSNWDHKKCQSRLLNLNYSDVIIYPEINPFIIVSDKSKYRQIIIPSHLKTEILELLDKQGTNKKSLGL